MTKLLDLLHPTLQQRCDRSLLAELDEEQNTLMNAALAGQSVLAEIPLVRRTASMVLLAALHRVFDRGETQARALLVLPTLQLLRSIETESAALLGDADPSICLVDDEPLERQAEALKGEGRLVLATPKRLREHLANGTCAAEKLTVLVFYQPNALVEDDIAEGETGDLAFISAKLTGDFQTLVVAETLTSALKPLIDAHCQGSVRISIDEAEQDTSAESGMQHRAFEVPRHLKSRLLRELVKAEDIKGAAVFVEGRYRADRLVSHLRNVNVRAKAIHDGQSRNQRSTALAGFHDGKYPVLIITMRAVRWVKLPALDVLINYELPRRPGDYMRMVRRVKDTGTIITLYEPTQVDELDEIRRTLGEPVRDEELDGFDYDLPAPTDQPDEEDQDDASEALENDETGDAPEPGRRRERRSQLTGEFTWDPEVPRSWGNRALATRGEGEKVALDVYEPEPLPDIWSRPGKYADLENKPRIPVHKFPEPGEADRPSSGKSRRRGRRRGGRGRDASSGPEQTAQAQGGQPKKQGAPKQGAPKQGGSQQPKPQADQPGKSKRRRGRRGGRSRKRGGNNQGGSAQPKKSD